jgi:hypothetical protein
MKENNGDTTISKMTLVLMTFSTTTFSVMTSSTLHIDTLTNNKNLSVNITTHYIATLSNETLA